MSTVQQDVPTTNALLASLQNFGESLTSLEVRDLYILVNYSLLTCSEMQRVLTTPIPVACVSRLPSLQASLLFLEL